MCSYYGYVLYYRCVQQHDTRKNLYWHPFSELCIDPVYYGISHTHSLHRKTAQSLPYLLLGVGVVKDVVDSPHLDEDGSIAEGVPEASQPDLEVAEDSSGRGRGGRPDRDNDGEIEENGSWAYQVVQVGGCQSDQPAQTIDILMKSGGKW